MNTSLTVINCYLTAIKFEEVLKFAIKLTVNLTVHLTTQAQLNINTKLV